MTVPARPRVIVAHEAEALRDSALRVVREAGFEAVAVADGDSALTLVASPPHPAALVVDVALPRKMGYELVEEIRARELPVKVVLIASVYSKTAYKRRPTRLYGADDYVEQHHIPDKLAEKLLRLVPTDAAPAARSVHASAQLTPEEQAEVEHIREAGEARLDFGDLSRNDAIARARRVARLIVADVVLYNGTVVEEALRDGGIVAARLARDLKAARELLAVRLPGPLVAECDFIGDALSDLIDALHEKPPGGGGT